MVNCARCTRPVYFAEEARAVGKVFHKQCLSCVKCRKMLDSTTCRDHDEEIYCKNCYGKYFGPKGYGFAGGASGLSMDTGKAYDATTRNIPVGLSHAQVPRTIHDSKVEGRSLNTCPVCKRPVFLAEKVTGPGSQAYHKFCFKCTLCNKILDSTTLTEREYQIYCKACYNKNFGPTGFGHGQTIQKTC